MLNQSNLREWAVTSPAYGHQFNYDLLEDVNFWRDFLSDGEPRIILRFGKASGIIIPTTLMASNVQGPAYRKNLPSPSRISSTKTIYLRPLRFNNFKRKMRNSYRKLKLTSRKARTI